MRNIKQLAEEINKLKKEKNAVILGHCYQNLEIDEVADYVGDSLQLSRLAAQTDADIIVFAGVYFMAETAKILSPNKKVLLPRLDAGCRMADMVDLEQMREFKAKNPDIPVVCYVNSSAEVKAETDICCTSANAVHVVKSLNVPKILFAPDKYLGSYVASQLKDVEVITYPGYCPTHLNILVEDVEKMKAEHPEAKVLVHPECHKAVADMGDYVGSTTGIMNYAKNSDAKEFIIGTENSIVSHLQLSCPDKMFYPLSKDLICHNMKITTIVDVLNCVKGISGEEIILDEDVRLGAKRCIDKMIELG